MFTRQKKSLPDYLLIICGLLPFFLSACNLFGGNSLQNQALVKAPKSQQTYTVPEAGLSNLDFDTLDPALAHDPASISAVHMIYTGLVQLNDKLQVEPQLAQNWQLSPDGLTWTFHLKPHLKFSDGTRLTSTDIAYSINRALESATQSTVAPVYLRLIKDSDQLLAGHITTLIGDSILTPNANTVVIITSQKAAYFLAMLTYTCSYVVEQSLIKKYNTQFTNYLEQGGGAGPFKVAQYIHHSSITFVPNSNYYDARPQLQKVSFVFYRSDDETYQDYLNNKLDMTDIPAADLAVAAKRKDFHQIAQLWTNYYTMNYLVKPFDNIHIRQAFALAINKVAIAKNIWDNTVIPTNHIVPQGMEGYNANLTGPDGTQNLTGNATLARQLLQQGLREEGWKQMSQMPAIQLSYVTGVSSFDQEVAALIQTWQKVLGMTVTPNPISNYNTLLDKVTASTNNANVEDGLQMWGLSWIAEYPDPQDWLSLQFGNNNTNNNMNYGQNTSSDAAKQQATQQQLAHADANMVATARLQSYQQAEQQLVNDVAWIPMDQATSTYLLAPSIVGIPQNGQGIIPPDDWAHIYRGQ